MPPVTDPDNLYSDTTPGKFSPAVEGALTRIYVPNRGSNDVSVIDPATMQVVDTFKVGINPQHVVPSWDLKTLWVTNNAEGRTDGTLTPIDPKTGEPRGPAIAVDDPYNMYFTPDGKSAIVVAEARKRLDFLDPQTMQHQVSVDVPNCAGVNHADFSIDGKFAIFTCEFQGSLVKVDIVNHTVLGYLTLSGGTGAMPQDIRVSPDGEHVLRRGDDARRRVHDRSVLVHRDRLHPDRHRHARALPEPRRHQALRRQPRAGPRREQHAERARQRVGDRLRHEGRSSSRGPSPAAAAPTWATSASTAARCGSAVATTTSSTRSTPPTARVTKIPVGQEPHGLAVWPQPGRYSLGHTGNMR